eukprot:451568-Pelagomonas_calceolata.AAC.1
MLTTYYCKLVRHSGIPRVTPCMSCKWWVGCLGLWFSATCSVGNVNGLFDVSSINVLLVHNSLRWHVCSDICSQGLELVKCKTWSQVPYMQCSKTFIAALHFPEPLLVGLDACDSDRDLCISL